MPKKSNIGDNEVDFIVGNSQSSQQSISQDDDTQEADISTVARIHNKSQKPFFNHRQTDAIRGVGNAQTPIASTNQDYSLDIPQEQSTQKTQSINSNNSGVWMGHSEEALTKARAELKKRKAEKEREQIEQQTKETLEDTLVNPNDIPLAEEPTPDEIEIKRVSQAIPISQTPKTADGWDDSTFGPGNRTTDAANSLVSKLPGTKTVPQQDNTSRYGTEKLLEDRADETEDIPIAEAVEPGYGLARVRNESLREAALANQNIGHEFTIEEHLANRDYNAAIKYCQENGLEERAREIQKEQKTQKEIESMPLALSEDEFSITELLRNGDYAKVIEIYKNHRHAQEAKILYDKAKKILRSNISQYSGQREKLAEAQMKLLTIYGVGEEFEVTPEEKRRLRTESNNLRQEAERNYASVVSDLLEMECYDAAKEVVNKAEFYGFKKVVKHYEKHAPKQGIPTAPKQGLFSRLIRGRERE